MPFDPRLVVDAILRECEPSEEQFERAIQTEAGCEALLMRLRWPDGFRCPRCNGTGSRIHRRGQGRPLFECSRCRKQTSLTSGTIFHGTRKPLKLWFRAILLTVSSGLNARELQGNLGVTYETAWTWGHKLRRAMGAAREPVAPPGTAERLAALPRRERRLAAWKLQREGLLILDTEQPEGRPCCGRLNRVEWSVPRDDDGDESDTVGQVGVRADRPTQSFHERAYARWKGGVSRKHVAAYAKEEQFLENWRRRPTWKTAVRIVRLGLAVRPYFYRAIVEPSRPQLPAEVHARLPAALAEALCAPESRPPRTERRRRSS